MVIRKGKLNSYFIDINGNPVAIFTDATESEFNELLDNFISKIDGRKFRIGFFRNYVAESGYYIYYAQDPLIPHKNPNNCCKPLKSHQLTKKRFG